MKTDTRNLFLFFFVLVGLSGGCRPVCTAEGPRRSQSIRLASYNIRTICDGDDRAWTVRAGALTEVVRRNEFDMFAVQEALAAQLKDLAALDEYAYIGRDRDGDGKGEHCAVFYKKDRFNVLDHGDFWYSETPGVPSCAWGARLNRMCSWGCFKDRLTGKTFYVFNSHTDHESAEARVRSSRLLLKQVKRIARGETAFCTGDLNATPDEEPIRILSDDGLLVDSYLCTKTPPLGPAGSFYAYRFDDPTPPKRIDFIFVTKNVEVLSYRTVDDDKKFRRYSSDHYPVLIEACWN